MKLDCGSYFLPCIGLASGLADLATGAALVCGSCCRPNWRTANATAYMREIDGDWTQRKWAEGKWTLSKFSASLGASGMELEATKKQI